MHDQHLILMSYPFSLIITLQGRVHHFHCTDEKTEGQNKGITSEGPGSD